MKRKPRRRSFGILILTHGRPDNVLTWRSLERSGYTGEVLLVVDNEDAKLEEYIKTFGKENVVVFDKAAVAAQMDTADLTNDRRAVVFARNAATDIARARGWEYYAQFDDDYANFMYRTPREDGSTYGRVIDNMDGVIEATLQFLDDSGALTVAWSQGGDHMGGLAAFKGLKRKAMNSFFMRTARPVRFVGRLNEDVNAYVLGGSRGDLYLTTMTIQLTQMATQSSAGGMTGAYKDQGTYVKSFFTVMMAPSCVRVGSIGRYRETRRFHHHVNWEHAVPKVISDRYRKSPPAPRRGRKAAGAAQPPA